MTLLLRLLGTLLLLLAGMGGGFAAAARAENSRRQLHSFARLLTYLAELLDAQALTGPELLRRAAQDQAMMTTLAGLIVVLSMLVRQISDLFVLIKALFEL